MLAFYNLHLYLREVIGFVVTIVKHFATLSWFKAFMPVSLCFFVPYCVVYFVYSIYCWHSTVLEASYLDIVIRWEGFLLCHNTWFNTFRPLLIRICGLNTRFTVLFRFLSLHTSCSTGLCLVKNFFLWLDIGPKLLSCLHMTVLHHLFRMLRSVRLVIIKFHWFELFNFTSMFVLIDNLILQVVLIVGRVHHAAIYCFELALPRLGGDINLRVVKWIDEWGFLLHLMQWSWLSHFSHVLREVFLGNHFVFERSRRIII